MAQVEEVTGAGATKSGCGFTAHANCLIPLDQRIDDDVEVVVASVSIWDVDATSEEISEGYRAAHEHLSALAPTVWVELPPVFGVPSNHPSHEDSAELNEAVAEALGCELEHWSIRKAPTVDGVHYDSAGARRVAGRLGTLHAADACRTG